MLVLDLCVVAAAGWMPGSRQLPSLPEARAAVQCPLTTTPLMLPGSGAHWGGAGSDPGNQSPSARGRGGQSKAVRVDKDLQGAGARAACEDGCGSAWHEWRMGMSWQTGGQPSKLPAAHEDFVVVVCSPFEGLAIKADTRVISQHCTWWEGGWRGSGRERGTHGCRQYL